MADSDVHACSLAGAACCLCCLSKPSKPKFLLHHWITVPYIVALLLLSVQHRFNKENTCVGSAQHLLYSKLNINGYAKMSSTSCEMPSNSRHGLVRLTILLLLAGDVERNPGPQSTAKTSTGIFQCALFATLLNNLLVANARPGLPLFYISLALQGQPLFAIQSMACLYSPPVLPWLFMPVARLGAFVGGCSVEFAWMAPSVATGPGLRAMMESSGVALAAGPERLQLRAMSGSTNSSGSVKEVISLQERNINISSETFGPVATVSKHPKQDQALVGISVAAGVFGGLCVIMLAVLIYKIRKDKMNADKSSLFH